MAIERYSLDDKGHPLRLPPHTAFDERRYRRPESYGRYREKVTWIFQELTDIDVGGHGLLR